MNRAGDLIECAETYTESYGIPRAVLAVMCDQALILTGGVPSLFGQRLPNSISIFIQPVSAARRRRGSLSGTAQTASLASLATSRKLQHPLNSIESFLNKDFAETLEQIEDFYLSVRRQRPHGRPAHKFDTGAGKGTGDDPVVLCVPRLETGAKPGSPVTTASRELRIDGRRVSQLVPALQGDRGPMSSFGQEFCARAASLGRSVPRRRWSRAKSRRGRN